MSAATYVAFSGPRRIATGSLADVLPVLKSRFDHDRSDLPLVFEVETGKQVDFDLRGSLADVLERASPKQRGPGRPKLGVVGREVSLLPRHWEWLERHQSGSSGALRRLVEAAVKHQPGKERAQRIRAALSNFLTSMAGDRPHFEEVTRALFRGDVAQLEALVARWPKDVRAFVVEKAKEAARAEAQPLDAATVVTELHRLVWSEGDYDAIERLVAPTYEIHSDPGDAWEGRGLDRATYRERVGYSRTAFPDLRFHLDEIIVSGDRAATRWHAEGTQTGPLAGLPATGKRLRFAGQTIYELRDGQVAGHWQVVDRLGFLGQLGSGRPR